ncbi:hypothetical protein BLL42_14150 [Pseudomonas frederiksbergensis]|uniref:DUF6531 domain-containing protein n=1 Tax=Pseudomonas frederiksbergensis TaxID=104087 RepID=A0A1J0ETY2_9PSED|nr:hypothetical protein BLL42_14150 [Pseudomonas frederiksbergensis]
MKTFGGSCPSSIAGNPINFSTGQKIQIETDFAPPKNKHKPNSVRFSRTYTSANGLWTHSYNYRLDINSEIIALFNADGTTSTFDRSEPNLSVQHPEQGFLARKGNRWRYQSKDNHFYDFDDRGKLLAIEYLGALQHIKQDKNYITVTDEYGTHIKITEDPRGQPVKLESQNVTIDYSYNEYKQLKRVTRLYEDGGDKKDYLYEDERNPTLLTGIIDERGIRYASWSYDGQGRAISSEHGAAADRMLVNYNNDGSTTIINALGKSTHYKFDLIQNVKHIISIKGLPSANCPDSNSSFTYDDRGNLKTKTNNNGNITTYSYNDRRLETSRTEASGTPDAKTIATEWHPTLFSPVRITEPNRLIQYTYDAQGRQLSKTVISR